jgi:hypothetical protein
MGANKTGLNDLSMQDSYGADMMNCWSEEFLRYRGMEHGAGWIGLVTTLHFRLRFLVGSYTIYQIKEKFGALRYYCTAEGEIPEGLPDTDVLRETVRRLIEDAEHRSATICERCGHAGTNATINRWCSTRCGPCRDQENAEREKTSSSTED